MTLTEMTIADIQRALADGELSARDCPPYSRRYGAG